MECTNQRGKGIPRNTPRVNGPTGLSEGMRQPRKEWLAQQTGSTGLMKGRKIKRVLIFKFK
jgi:hypothetical protein